MKNKVETLSELIKVKYKFRKISYETILTIVSQASFKKFKKEDHVYLEGDEVKYIYFILSGKVELYFINSQLAKKIATTLSPGDDFSLPAIINSFYHNILYTHYAHCTENSEIALIPKDNFHNMLKENNQLCITYLEMCCQVMHEHNMEFIKNLSEEKIIVFIKNIMDNKGYYKNNQLYIPKSISIQKISEILFLARETVSRVISNLEKKKIIKINRDCYTILDPQYIKNIASNNSNFTGFYGSID